MTFEEQVKQWPTARLVYTLARYIVQEAINHNLGQYRGAVTSDGTAELVCSELNRRIPVPADRYAQSLAVSEEKP